ncbi:hypothetical protein HYV82_04860 [Candidatus Woesearchaeota archaeon]|nr:hypothetical protein [Candidatus Woesearchaeota archaeon]
MGAIVLLFIIGAAYFWFSRAQGSYNAGVSGNGDAINLYVRACLEKTAQTGVVSLAKKGGYYDLSQVSHYRKGVLEIPYYLDKTDRTPSLSTLESEFSKYVNNELPKCADMSLFIKQGLNIKTSQVTAKTTIADGKIIVETNYRIAASSGNSKYVLEKFSTEIKTEYKKTHEISAELVKKAISNPKRRDLTYFSKLGQTVTVIPQNSKIDTYIITEPGYNFIFAVKTE